MAKLKFNPFIATLAASYIGRGAVMVVSENRNLSGFSDQLIFLGEGKTLGVPNLLLIFLGLAVVGQWILSKTVFGHQLFAIGGNAEARASPESRSTESEFRPTRCAVDWAGWPGFCWHAGSESPSNRLASVMKWTRSPGR